MMTPEPGCFQHIGFIYECNFFSPVAGKLKGKMRNPLNLCLRIGAIIQCPGLLFVHFFFTEVNTSGKFTENNEINACEGIGFQGRQMVQ